MCVFIPLMDSHILKYIYTYTYTYICMYTDTHMYPCVRVYQPKKDLGI